MRKRTIGNLYKSKLRRDTALPNKFYRLHINPNNPFAPSFPRRRESSKKTLREADKIAALTRYAGFFPLSGFPPARE